MPIDRTWWNNLVDDDGSGMVGTVWNKAAIKGLLDAIDGCGLEQAWTPTDGSGAALVLTIGSPGKALKLFGRVVIAIFNVNYPSTANGAAASIAGLPFPVAGQNAAGGGIGYTNMSPRPLLLPTDGSSRFALYADTGAAVTNAQMSGKSLAGFVVYFVP